MTKKEKKNQSRIFMYAIMSLYRFAEVPRTKTTTTNNMPRIRCIWKCNLKICIATEKLNNTTTKTVITLPKCKQCHKQPHQIGTKTNGKNEAAPAKPRAEKQDAFLFLTFSLSPPPTLFAFLCPHCTLQTGRNILNVSVRSWSWV